jgi:hypothetical protein
VSAADHNDVEIFRVAHAELVSSGGLLVK